MKLMGDFFEIDGEKTLIVSGAIHYFRMLVEDWEDRLEKLASAGFNCVETYIPWNLHEPEEGKYNFEGNLNIGKFIELAEKKGLYVILRPSPYICAEWEFGGLPSWLLKYPNIKLRTIDSIYLEKVDRYYDNLIPKLLPYMETNGGNVIAVQIENEYGSYGNDKDYLSYIENALVKRGIQEQLFTSDGPTHWMLTGGTLPHIWKTINFGSRAKESFELLKEYQIGLPKMVMEFWIGWFDHWGQKHIVRDSKEIEEELTYMLENNISVNFYMFFGGTNFGFMSGANYEGEHRSTVTSYDYDALLSENGDMTEKYEVVKKVIAKYQDKIKKHKNHKFYDVKNSKKMDYGIVELNESTTLCENLFNLSTVYKTKYIKTMEEVNQDYGFILYKTKINNILEDLKLTIQEVRDRALVYLNGQYQGVIDRNNNQEIILNSNTPISTLEIIVENMGRINYGPQLVDKKGITEGVRIANQFLFDWEIYTLPLNNIEGLKYKSNLQIEENIPTFYKGDFFIEELGDTYLDFEGWSKGVVYINNFNIGTYWEIGPQKRLFIPKGLLKLGHNEIVIFELHKGGNKIKLVKEPKFI